MSTLRFAHFSFTYDLNEAPLFNDVSFTIDTSWKCGLVARNGYGKTTLLKCMMKQLEYDGSITIPFPLLYFPFTIPYPELTCENMLYTLDFEVELWKVKKEMQLLHLDYSILNQSYNTLSLGQQTQFCLAILFSVEHHYLLLDEPSNHLDQYCKSIITNYLNDKTHFLLVSHDRQFLDDTIDHILVINHQNIDVYATNFSLWYDMHVAENKTHILKNEQLKKEIKSLSKSASEKQQWSDKVEATKIGNGPCDRGYIGHMAAKMAKRSKAIEQRVNAKISEKKSHLQHIEIDEPLKMNCLIPTTQPILQFHNGALHLLNDKTTGPFSFTLNSKDRIALCGRNGCGKSTLIKTILDNNYTTIDGYYYFNNQCTISYLPQDTSFLIGNLVSYIQSLDIERSFLMTLLSKLNFNLDNIYNDMTTYSKGEKKKVALAITLAKAAHIFILDEPLNDVDIFTRQQIIDVIEACQPTLLFVEHDSYFTNRIATKQIELNT